MNRFAVGFLTACCALAAPATLGGVAEAETAPAPSSAFPKSVQVTVQSLDVTNNAAFMNRIFCSPYDAAACAGSKVRTTLTLTAATAAAAGISKREISSVVKTLDGKSASVNFKHDLSSSEVSKLKKLEKAGKKIKMVVVVSVTKGATTRKAPSQVMTGAGTGQSRTYTFKVGEGVDYSGGPR